MSLVTACPACGVLFKVAPDQLLISEGWVRCGKCQTVFDAALNFQPQLATVAPKEPELVPPPAGEAVVQALRPLQLPLEVASGAKEPIDPYFDLNDATASADVHVAPAPVQEEPVAARWFWATVALYALAALLLLALALQVVLFERNEIASREPRAKPWLLALCQPFHCELETLKRIQSIVIDGSTFLKIGPDSYQLTLVLKNTSAAALHLPSVELTLINSLDQPLLRRVFSIDELRVESSTLLSFSELPLSFSFAIKPGDLPERVSGYRVLVFYP